MTLTIWLHCTCNAMRSLRGLRLSWQGTRKKGRVGIGEGSLAMSLLVPMVDHPWKGEGDRSTHRDSLLRYPKALFITFAVFQLKCLQGDRTGCRTGNEGESKQQLISWPALALLGCCLVSLHVLCDILLSTGPVVREHV